jgi:hypothetical protein
MSAITVKGIKGWMNRCRELALPVMAGSVQTLTRQIKTGASLGEMSETLERDPALAFHVFVAANQRNRNADTEILNAQHVMSQLGLQGLINSLKPLLKLPLEEHNAYHSAYYQAQLNSLFAAKMAAHFAEAAGINSGERMQWACMLAGAPSWLMWRGAYAEMRELEYRNQTSHNALKVSEMQVLGCHLEDLYRMQGRELLLTNSSQLALESAQLPSLQEWARLLRPDYKQQLENNSRLKFLRRQPHVLIACCLHLASQLEQGWGQRKSLRAMTILAHLCGLNVQDTYAQCRQIALHLSHSFPLRDVRPPAIGLLSEPHDTYRPPSPVVCISQAHADVMPAPVKRDTNGTPTPSTSKTSAGVTLNHAHAEVTPRHINHVLMAELLQQFSAQVSGFKDIHHILLTCNRALHEGLGMRRAFICVLNKTGDTLRAVYNVGVETDNPIRGLSIPLTSNRFFSKLLQKPSSLKVDTYNYGQVRNMLSQEVLSALGNKNFMAMSLFANNKAIGVVYSDTSQEELQISENEYEVFKKICHFTSEAIDHYAARQRK